MDRPGRTVHPIESESYRILAERVDLSGFPAGPRAVVERVIHATADPEYARTLVVSEEAVDAGVRAVQTGAPIVTDGEMTRAGISGGSALCYLNEAGAPAGASAGAAVAEVAGSGVTRSARGMRIAADRHPHGAVIVIGSAPTALAEVVALALGSSTSLARFAPALIIGLPVGFVGAAAAKEAARRSGLQVITNKGEKGGAAAAAAACNALIRLASGRGE
jgi:precorrin-8X/cobalt-precorrin-8 methylmutase